jgi:hypothetical protein
MPDIKVVDIFGFLAYIHNDWMQREQAALTIRIQDTALV